jgi:hypothetical protein
MRRGGVPFADCRDRLVVVHPLRASEKTQHQQHDEEPRTSPQTEETFQAGETAPHAIDTLYTVEILIMKFRMCCEPQCSIDEPFMAAALSPEKPRRVALDLANGRYEGDWLGSPPLRRVISARSLAAEPALCGGR